MALFNKLLLFIALCLTSTTWAFIAPHHQSTQKIMSSSSRTSTSSSIQLSPITTTVESTTQFFDTTSSSSSSTELLSVATLDPTTVLSDALGGLLGSSLILAVPIVAALSVAGLIAFFIVSYANPEDEDD